MGMEMNGAMMAVMGSFMLLLVLLVLALLTLAVVASVWLIKNMKSGGAEGRARHQDHL